MILKQPTGMHNFETADWEHCMIVKRLTESIGMIVKRLNETIA